MDRRPYRDASDVERLQAFNAAAFAETDGCGFLHPGDVPHHLFSGNKLYEPAEVMTIWEDGDEVAAWAIAAPRFRGYDVQVRPDLRGRSFEREVLEYAEAETVGLMAKHGIEADMLEGWAYRCDVPLHEMLTELGWSLDGKPPDVMNRRLIGDPGEPVLPDGYRIRAARGLEDAAALAEVHAASFGSTWTAEMYAKLMQSPGYEPEREFVVEAPDGGFAAFTLTWHDQVNRTGHFEPVGTHRNHRRKGLARALLMFGMRAMAEAGMAYAIVGNLGDNNASRALYLGAGFEPWHLIDSYTKPIPG